MLTSAMPVARSVQYSACLVGAVQALVASSRMTMRGVRAKTRANARRCCSPVTAASQSCDAFGPPTRSRQRAQLHLIEQFQQLVVGQLCGWLG